MNRKWDVVANPRHFHPLVVVVVVVVVVRPYPTQIRAFCPNQSHIRLRPGTGILLPVQKRDLRSLLMPMIIISLLMMMMMMSAAVFEFPMILAADGGGGEKTTHGASMPRFLFGTRRTTQGLGRSHGGACHVG